MRRRTFLETLVTGTAAAGSATLFPRSIAAAEHRVQTSAPIGMKITAVEPIMIQGARGYHAWNLVKVKSDQGIEGIGEGFAFAYGKLDNAKIIHGHIRLLGESIVGTNPVAIQSFLTAAWSMAPEREDAKYWAAAIAAIETALWDIFGKSVNLPVHALLGGKVRQRIPLYANHGVFFDDERSHLEYLEDFGGLVQRVLSLKEAGYKMFKWDPFSEGGNPGAKLISERVAAVAKVREAVGPDYEIGIDAHGRFDIEGAILAAKAMEPLKIGFFEEPVDFKYPSWFPRIADSTSIPLATGEHLARRAQAAEILKTGAIRFIQPELGNFGGILETMRAASMSESFNVRFLPHNYCGPIVTRALMQVSCVLTNLHYMEYAACGKSPPWERELIDPPNQVVNGQMKVPDGPGLGFRLNEDLVMKRRIHL